MFLSTLKRIMTLPVFIIVSFVDQLMHFIDWLNTIITVLISGAIIILAACEIVCNIKYQKGGGVYGYFTSIRELWCAC